MLEVDNQEEQVEGDHRVLLIVFSKILEAEPISKAWRTSWDIANGDLHVKRRGDEV